MRTICILLLIPLLLSSCVSTSNLFQDGKSLGKGNVELGGSFTIHQVPKLESKITDDRTGMPWFQAQSQVGVTKKLDLGGGVGISGIGIGGQAFAKYALLPAESKTGIALLALAGYASSGSKGNYVEDATFQWADHARYINFTYSVPISFRANDAVTFVLQPIYGKEIMTVFPADSFFSPTEPTTTRTFESVKLGIGPIVDVGKVRIHINLTTAYIMNTNSFAPSIGVAGIVRLF
ncbi:MAG TPA: hypothetical protein VFE50_18400 [Cyclobacteriaceae bacterium]|nr:hypothetical protein [Cyclobacteriaceae bacterium]